ncbi:protein LIFEGUARD 4 [Sesamum angolense]|uniref:Protein LIFEGUARD 4 n=1 Tax=Sesamum angolense TaxID=2727404 RepID=A0AAE2BK35_9LAMI|nr:protein LIFEGUARD 4 [Sesamum angolense]
MAGFSTANNVDVEAGGKRGGRLYPGMQEDPMLRWAFIRKVYSILCLQFILVVGVAFAMLLTPPVRDFLRTPNGRYVMIALILVTFVCHAVIVAASLTLLIVVALTMFTFVAAKMGYDFHFLGPFLLCAVLLLVTFGLMRTDLDVCANQWQLMSQHVPTGGSLNYLSYGPMVQQVIGCLTALVFSGFIIYDTDNVIKRFNYDQYIDGAACLFSDMINLFLSLLSILQSVEKCPTLSITYCENRQGADMALNGSAGTWIIGACFWHCSHLLA